ncbi:MAG: hypothetical protein R3362_06980, partial [Rhodothermales bacterium]|nr:hypothetical protein [Rhodothermales bacterium]
GNLFANAGFESGPEPWFSIVADAGFEVTAERAHTGDHSALLRVDDPASAEGEKVYYLVQEIEPDGLPEIVQGTYRVENWDRGAPVMCGRALKGGSGRSPRRGDEPASGSRDATGRGEPPEAAGASVGLSVWGAGLVASCMVKPRGKSVRDRVVNVDTGGPLELGAPAESSRPVSIAPGADGPVQL